MRYGDATWETLPIGDRPSFYQLAKDDLTEPSPVEADGGHLIGRDPRQLSKETLAKYYRVEPGGAGNGRVVRAKCLDCCCYQEAEIRKCTALCGRIAWGPTHSRRGRAIPAFLRPLIKGLTPDAQRRLRMPSWGGAMTNWRCNQPSEGQKREARRLIALGKARAENPGPAVLARERDRARRRGELPPGQNKRWGKRLRQVP
jgi:hypothetical protein